MRFGLVSDMILLVFDTKSFCLLHLFEAMYTSSRVCMLLWDNTNAFVTYFSVWLVRKNIFSKAFRYDLGKYYNTRLKLAPPFNVDQDRYPNRT